MRLAIDRLWTAAQADPTQTTRDVTLPDLRNASEKLEGTYLIRLFAEFETGLRDYWEARRTTRSPSRTRDLLDGVAAMREIRLEQPANAQSVREYRNALVHERAEAKPHLSIAEARRHLCRYFRFLPPRW